MAGQRMRIGAACERVGAPARFGERPQTPADVVAEQCGDVVDRLRRQGALAGRLDLAREAAAIKTFDAGLPKRTQLEAADTRGAAAAAHARIFWQVLPAVERKDHLI